MTAYYKLCEFELDVKIEGVEVGLITIALKLLHHIPPLLH
jgi:hypothetical protein